MSAPAPERTPERTSETTPAGSGSPIVALEKLAKTYGKGDTAVHALRGVDIRIEHGEFVAVMGPSGSGKSTCMNILGCLDVPTSGSYKFDGVEVSRLQRRQRALLRRHYVGFVFQGFNLLPRTSALANVALPLLYRGAPGRERKAAALEALRIVGLEDRARHTPAELSGGQQQRVAIARAIVTRPRLLLADEPTGNLDSATSGEIMKLITGLNREHGITVVMVTHEPDIAAWARRTISFVDGVVASDTRRVAEEPARTGWAPRISVDGASPAGKRKIADERPPRRRPEPV